MTTPNPALVEFSERNRKFWLEQRLLMDQRMENRDILEIAIETIAFEAKRGVSVRSQMSFEKALENAAEAKKRFLHQQARSGGKAAKPDTFQMIIIDIVRRDPKIGVAGLLNGLRQREGDGVIEEVDDTHIYHRLGGPAVMRKEEKAVEKRATSAAVPNSGLKHRLTRARRKISNEDQSR